MKTGTPEGKDSADAASLCRRILQISPKNLSNKFVQKDTADTTEESKLRGEEAIVRCAKTSFGDDAKLIQQGPYDSVWWVNTKSQSLQESVNIGLPRIGPPLAC